MATQFGKDWRYIRDLADPDGVYIGDARRLQRTWLHEAIDRAFGMLPSNESQQVPAHVTSDKLSDNGDVLLRRALRIAQSSNFRREYPFDWGGMTRLALAANATTLVARMLLENANRRPLPYAARLVPKDDGRSRLKAGPWPEDALLQQYVLSDLLRARHETPGWYLDFPAVRLIRNSGSGPVVTGPDWLRPIGIPGSPSPVVSFAYQIDQNIVEGESPPRREGMFVPYRECWQQFTDHLDGFVAQKSISTDTFYAVRLDISGFFDNIPRFAIEDVLKRAMQEGAERNFSGRDFAKEVAELLHGQSVFPSDSGNRELAGSVSNWLLNQSFGYRYFDPEDGNLRSTPNRTVGIPQGPDLSAFLANMSLFPVDRLVTEMIDEERKTRSFDNIEAQPCAVYGRYVDDLVIVSTSDTLLGQIEANIALELRKRGLSMNSKHERARAMSRRQIREWLLGERGAAVLVSVGGEETPTTTRAGVAELIDFGPDTTRGDVLQLLHSDELYSPAWAEDKSRAARILDAFQTLRGLTSIELRYYDWVSAARWTLHSLINRSRPSEHDSFAQLLLREWREVYGKDTARPVFGEAPHEQALRQDRLTLAPLLMLFDAIERSIDSRHDRRGLVDVETRAALIKTRTELARMIHTGDLCGRLLLEAKHDDVMGRALFRVNAMLQIQRLSIMSLAASIVETVPVLNTLSDQLDKSSSYAERRFALNAMGSAIGQHETPLSRHIEDFRKLDWSPEAEPLLLFHEALARLRAGSPNGPDPLKPMSETVRQTVDVLAPYADRPESFDLGAAIKITGLVDQFLEDPRGQGAGLQNTDALRAFVEIVAGQTEGLARLANRNHLVHSLTQDDSELIAVPPGVDAIAVFSTASHKQDRLEALAFRADDVVLEADQIIFGVKAVSSNGSDVLARYSCSVPIGHRHAQPADQKLEPSQVTPADLRAFAQAYRDLVLEHSNAILNSETDAASDNRPITPLHLLRPEEGQSSWSAFGAVSRLPVGAQAFVRLGAKRLHSIAVYANGAHLWQVGFALADHLGYRGFARSSELDRLTVAALEPSDTTESIPFYVMQLTVPRLCGAFMGRSRIRIKPEEGIPPAIERQLVRLERFADARIGSIAHLAELFEAGAEARAGDILRDAPAPLQVAGALSSLFRAVGRAASRSEKVFTQNLPTAPSAYPTNRRNVDLWLAAAARLEGIPAANQTLGLKASAAAIRVGAIGKLAQALTLEIWALLNDDDRLRLGRFAPTLAEFTLPDELLLVSRSHFQKAPSAEDQAVRLVDVLIGYAGAGATSRSGLDRITPLGWVVALATVSGLINIEPLPAEADEGVAVRPELLAARVIQGNREPSLSNDENRLLKTLVHVASYLATSAEEDAASAIHEPEWPWSAFKPLVDDAESAVSRLVEGSLIVEHLYGLTARTYRSRLFQISEADDRGYCLVSREDRGRVNIAGWQIDRDSLSLSRIGDLEASLDKTGGREFVWSETMRHDRLVGISVAYRSLAEFAGQVDAPVFQSSEVSSDLISPYREQIPDPNTATVLEAPHDPTVDQSVSSETITGDTPADSVSEPPTSLRSAIVDEDVLARLATLWHDQRRWGDQNHGEIQPIAMRIAILQMNIDQIGHSFWHPICEVSGGPTKDWDKVLSDIRKGPSSHGKTTNNSSTHSSIAEAWRRAILTEALERCKTLGVELLILPEYGLRPDTIAWLSEQLEARAPRTSILAGTFRHAARATKLAYTTGTADREIALGAVVPLLVPSGALPSGNSRQRSGVQIFSRLKKYPSIGMSEVIRTEEKPLAAVYEMHSDDLIVPERLRYVRDLICSEVFMAMSPANIYSTVPAMVELALRFGINVKSQDVLKEVMEDIHLMAIDTSPAIFRRLDRPRKTIIAVPAATTRPFDHHIFGEASAKAAGLVTAFANMSGSRRGQSCFIGHYKSDQVEGSHVWGLQSPYHGRAPGIWTYNYSGGAPLGDQETALIVADVNPIDTNSSKPARQIENLPLALVAHIPFFLERPGESAAKSVKSRAQAVASKILAFLDPPQLTTGKLATVSSCEIDVARAVEAHRIAAELAAVDDRCSASLKLRAEGLRISSMQPHAHPRMPVLIDWAFIKAPSEGVAIEVPPLEAFDLDALEEG